MLSVTFILTTGINTIIRQNDRQLLKKLILVLSVTFILRCVSGCTISDRFCFSVVTIGGPTEVDKKQSAHKMTIEKKTS